MLGSTFCKRVASRCAMIFISVLSKEIGLQFFRKRNILSFFGRSFIIIIMNAVEMRKRILSTTQNKVQLDDKITIYQSMIKIKLSVKFA